MTAQLQTIPRPVAHATRGQLVQCAGLAVQKIKRYFLGFPVRVRNDREFKLCNHFS